MANKSKCLSSFKPISSKPNRSQNLIAFDKLPIDNIRNRKDEKLVFSFEVFDRSHKAFSLGNTEISWFLTVLDTLKEWSDKTWVELCQEYRAKFDPHKYDESSANVKPHEIRFDLEQHELYQLRFDKSNGRVHGFVIGNRFYIYWLDPHHNMYDSSGYPTYSKCLFNAPQTSYELVCDERNYVHEKLQKKSEELEVYFEMVREEFCNECANQFIKK